MRKKFSKPLPYLVQGDSYPVREAAQWLRKTFAPLMAKRLPTVLYGGFKHGFIAQFIQQHKKEYPFFLKIDIAKFYPSPLTRICNPRDTTPPLTPLSRDKC